MRKSKLDLVKAANRFHSQLTYSVRIMVDVNIKVLIHGGERRAMLEIIRGQASVDHVIVQSVEEFNVDVAHQGIQNFLQHIELILIFLAIFTVW